MSIDRKPRTYRRRTTIGGQFAPRLVEMLESPAWRVLSLAGHRVLDRLDIEHRHHGGHENGNLIVTFDQFEQYGIHRHSIAPAIREIEALGFIEITQRGRGGNAEYRTPHRFRLTSYGTEHAKGTNEWRRITTIEDAEWIAQQARNATQPKHSPVVENANLQCGKPPPKTGNSQWRKPHYCPSAESTTTLDISGWDAISPLLAPLARRLAAGGWRR